MLLLSFKNKKKSFEFLFYGKFQQYMLSWSLGVLVLFSSVFFVFLSFLHNIKIACEMETQDIIEMFTPVSSTLRIPFGKKSVQQNVPEF